MKRDMINETVEEYLGDFVCKVANSVIVAKSFRGEVPEGQQQQQLDAPVDPFKDVDLDNLPDAAKAAIEKARSDIANLQTTAKTATQKAAETEVLARQHQSRADRYDTELRKRNLHPEQQQQQQRTEEDELLEELTAKFVSKGLKPEDAKVHAIMHAEAVKLGEERTLKKVGQGLGGTIQSVGVLQIDRILEQATGTQDFGPSLQNPEVANKTREVLNTIVANGNSVDQETFKTALQIAVGELTMAGKLNPNNDMQQTQQRQTTGNIFSGSAPFNNPQMVRQGTQFGNSGGAPLPHKGTNPETDRAINQTVKALTQGLKKK